MAESTLTTPYEYATELLTLCAAAVAATDAGEIERRYVDWGKPAFDCEQLTVSGWSLGEAPTVTGTALGAGKRHVHGRVNLLGFLVTVVRDCAPTMDDSGNAPESVDIAISAKEMFDAVWAIWTKVYQAKRAGTLFEGLCDELYFDGGRALDTEGTLRGAEIEFRAEIRGIIANGP